MNIRQSLQQIINQHPYHGIDFEEDQSLRLKTIIYKIHQTFTLLNRQMCITPDIQDYDPECKDPILILNLIVKMFALCNANIKENGLNSFDKLIEKLIKLIHSEDTQKCLEESARLSIQNFDLKKRGVKLQHDILIINQKLMASQQAYKNIVGKATDTIEAIKCEFIQVLQILKHNQDLMLKLQSQNKTLKDEKSQLKMFIKDYKETLKYRKDPEVLKNRQVNMLKAKYQATLKQLDKHYRSWCSNLQKNK